MQTVNSLVLWQVVILFLCGTGFAEPSELKASENPLAFFCAITGNRIFYQKKHFTFNKISYMAPSLQTHFNAPSDLVFKACLVSLATLGYHLTNSQKEGGIISFQTGRSLYTWKGQKLTCTIIEISEGKTEVIVSGVMAGFQITDWGEAERIARKVLKEVSYQLSKN